MTAGCGPFSSAVTWKNPCQYFGWILPSLNHKAGSIFFFMETVKKTRSWTWEESLILISMVYFLWSIFYNFKEIWHKGHSVFNWLMHKTRLPSRGQCGIKCSLRSRSLWSAENPIPSLKRVESEKWPICLFLNLKIINCWEIP